MIQAKTAETVEGATVYVKCNNITVITKAISKLIKKLNEVEYKIQTIT